MNQALDMYQENENVISVHAYNYPLKDKAQLPETFFLIGADCWGWATWKSGWDLFNPDGKILLKEIEEKKLSVKFNYKNNIDFLQMLKDQIDGKVDSWAIRWYVSAFLKEKMTLYPAQSYVKNIGIDGTGTHADNNNNYNVKNLNSNYNLIKVEIKHNEKAYNLISEFFSTRNKGMTILQRLKNKLKFFGL